MKMKESKLRRIIRKVITEAHGNMSDHGYGPGRSPVSVGFPSRKKPDEWYESIVNQMSFEQAEEWLQMLVSRGSIEDYEVLYFLKGHPDCPLEIREG